MLNINTNKNLNTNTSIFYRDEDGNPLCSCCVAEQYPANHNLLMEVVDLDAEPVECDGCGEVISSSGEDDDYDEWD